MKIEFAPIASFSQTEAAALVLEISAVLNGVGLIDDAQPDLELLLAELRANPADFDLEEEGSFLSEEDFAGQNLAKEKFTAAIAGVLDNRRETFGKAYPFVIKYADGPVVDLLPMEEISAAGVAVVAMALFAVLEDQNLTQISREDRARFSKLFEPIFELVCALALSADNEGVVWWNGRSRSRKTFLRQLNIIRDFVGSGLVRTEAQLQENQTGVNDGGVDAFGITTVAGNVGPDATCSLLGATLQRSARRNKIVGRDELIRLSRFFINPPNLTFAGILAIPFGRQEAEAQDCRDANCRYMPVETIYRNLALIAGRPIVPRAEMFATKIERQLASRSRKISKELAITLNGEDRRLPWP